MRIAFLGLGRMGSGMARNLLRAGHELTLYNRSRGKADAIGAPTADTPAAACRGCDVAITMLSDDAAVENVVFGPDGILSTGIVHIGSSTISTAFARRLAVAHQGHYVSAPVFGRPEAAEAKKLLIVPAGPAELIMRCTPVFDAIGRQTFIAGPEPWQANALKLCGNFMIASMIGSFGDAFGTLRKANVEPHLFLDVMNALFGSPVYANYGKLIADENFEPAGFALKLGLKDIRLALETAFECASPMPIASVVRDRLLDAYARGQGDWDWASMTSRPC
jgi:3-hydroxyisobutyrate dehydrogenase-like beta-hydroxyacid dehydrogenase